MSERQKSRNTAYEGPAELYQAAVPEFDVFTHKDMPGSKSVADRLTEQYGPQGTGWGVEDVRYADQNELKKQLHAPEFDLANEAFDNWLTTGRYELDDGTNAARLRRQPREPDTVDVVIYPDGKHFHDSQNQS